LTDEVLQIVVLEIGFKVEFYFLSPLVLAGGVLEEVALGIIHALNHLVEL
jgi:hypothetical protein